VIQYLSEQSEMKDLLPPIDFLVAADYATNWIAQK